MGLGLSSRRTGRIADAIACLVAAVNTTLLVISTDILEAEEHDEAEKGAESEDAELMSRRLQKFLPVASAGK